MFILSQKDCLHCLSCTAFAVLLNLSSTYYEKSVKHLEHKYFRKNG